MFLDAVFLHFESDSSCSDQVVKAAMQDWLKQAPKRYKDGQKNKDSEEKKQ